MSDLIDRQKAKDAIDMALDHIDHVPSWVYDNLLNALNEVPSVKPTHPTPSNTLGALDCIERRLVSYKLTDLINEFEEILSHIREREENDSVCGLCEYDGAYMGQSGDWCNECPGFDKADCFKLKDKYKKEWLELMNTLPSVQLDRDIPVKPIETIGKAWGMPKKEAVCPKCDYYLSHISFLGDYKGKRITYCETCGQAIDWEGWDWDE